MVGYLLALGVVALVSTIVVALATLRHVVRPTPNTRLLLRLYLEVAAFTGALFLVVELVGPVQWLLATVFGMDAIYGVAPLFQAPRPESHCAPANAPICQPADVQLAVWLADRERAHVQGLVRGAVFSVLAAVFSAGHLLLRRVVLDEGERGGLLHRAHLVIGLLTFGIVTALYLPNALVQLVDRLAYPEAWSSHAAVGVALPFGLSSLLAWVAYALLLVADLRTAPAPAARVDPDRIPAWR